MPVDGTSSAEGEATAKALRVMFDASFMSGQGAAQQTSGSSSGLFQSDALRSTEEFEALAERTLLRCRLVVARIEAAPNRGREEMGRVIRNLDRLSDLLCGVIDCAELIRNAHPDRRWVECANKTYEGFCGYMNELNTNTALYDVLAKVLSDKELCASLSTEALAVARVFQSDFEKSGIHLPETQRKRHVQLSDDILVLGRSFLQGSVEDETVVEMPLEWLRSTSPKAVVEALISSYETRNGNLLLRRNSKAMDFIARSAEDGRARKLAFANINTGTVEQTAILEQLLGRRAELARLTGSETYASMTLADKMARHPRNVDSFLASLAQHHQPLVERELAELRELKVQQEGTRELFAWDRDYYTERYKRSLELKHAAPPIEAFFSVGTVFAGLSRLFERLYGITFRAAIAQPGETWSSDVCKIDVMEHGHKIGTMYADLYDRPGKPPSAAHYTVRCSRRTDDDDGKGDFRNVELAADDRTLSADEAEKYLATLDTHPVRTPDREGEYQLPIIVLLFDFKRASRTGEPTLLRWGDVETLFHEMGHAIHSMIGRTEYHNVSGTRCATDFVELPSILMEHFVSSPEVVALVARHFRTDALLPYAHLQAHLAVQRSLDSLNTHDQIMLASLDQLYHGQSPAAFDSTALLHTLQSRTGIFPPVAGKAWQVNFGHLYGYGATYYSYLFDRAIASRIWQRLFRHAPLDRRAGDAFKSRVLAHGGGRDPWAMLADVLQDDELRGGGDSAQAMQAVGRWGIAEVGESKL